MCRQKFAQIHSINPQYPFSRSRVFSWELTEGQNHFKKRSAKMWMRLKLSVTYLGLPFQEVSKCTNKLALPPTSPSSSLPLPITTDFHHFFSTLTSDGGFLSSAFPHNCYSQGCSTSTVLSAAGRQYSTRWQNCILHYHTKFWMQV
jgi:hypothetical protein